MSTCRWHACGCFDERIISKFTEQNQDCVFSGYFCTVYSSTGWYSFRAETLFNVSAHDQKLFSPWFVEFHW